MNLVVNARDAMPGGGVLTIRTENVLLDDASCRGKPGARPGKWVRLEVADSGEGMDSEVMAHVFEPFYTTKEVGRGSGLGLSVVFGIVRQHGGWINLASVPGEGCSFSVYLPVVEDVPSPTVERDAAMPDGKGHGERILLVEDEGVVREMAERALTGRGYSVSPAKNAAEAQEIFESERVRFDLVFSDVVLPDGSGFDLAERLLSFEPELSVLLTSGYADRELTGSTIEDRRYNFLEKPYELADLLRAVGEALSQSRRKWEEGDQ
jgi:CheY-like chemotaxis protein